MAGINKNELVDHSGFAAQDPFSIRRRELDLELRQSMVVPVSDAELAAFRDNAIATSDPNDGLARLRMETFEDPLSLHAYYQAERRTQAVLGILAAEGITREAQA